MSERRNIWLILSLCLNVVLVAMIAVSIARAWHHQRDRAFGSAFSAQSIVARLRPDRAARVKAITDAHAAELGRLMDQATRARLDARPFFTRPVFDAAAYARAQQGIRSADAAVQAEKLKQLREIAALLTAQEREEIVARAREQGSRSSRR